MQDNLEHCLELPRYNLFLYLGLHPSKCSMPKEASGKRLDWKVYMESIDIVRRASSSFVHLCVACARICAGMGD